MSRDSLASHLDLFTSNLLATANSDSLGISADDLAKHPRLVAAGVTAQKVIDVSESEKERDELNDDDGREGEECCCVSVCHLVGLRLLNCCYVASNLLTLL